MESLGAQQLISIGLDHYGGTISELFQYNISPKLRLMLKRAIEVPEDPAKGTKTWCFVLCTLCFALVFGAQATVSVHLTR